ncbi:polyprenyl synthetase family protein [Actinobacteria bacterium YIM 96077]|uniref:Polyprenyl synthetase family protein n=1 Tax=Phytoactinopolyspora halophila TaxID=1981511 RepID=A0A329QTB5_9ACTN|nr:family 2 encapsulin nanocompartment cargo protein polyprenyl transferase [Phytoactinopolyspora halophila]AYY13812.1 polyprenyl synthetase family protein [Actinobacteria bacterium YIM 96077]RAW15644.1 polyprenyl synthetase family protein [Phytoactinopolyspora halophila]
MAVLETFTDDRPADEVLRWSRAMVEPALRTAVDELDEPMRHVASYHFGWCDEQGRPTSGQGGKVLRPALTLLCAEAVGGAPSSAVPAAVAVELAHNFSLLHDDVMDGDHTRRHRRTAWTVFGVDAAVLVGDGLLTLASHVVATSGHPAAQDGTRLLSAALLDLVNGQAADLECEGRDDVDVAECLAMVNGKTAALLGAACALGASFGNAEQRQVTGMHEFGRQVGMAFQIADDLLGIWGDPDVLGKPVHADLRARKKTVPVVAALTSGTPAGQQLAELYNRATPLSESELAHAAELIEAAGGRAWAREQTDAFLARALGQLEAAGVRRRACAELATLARLIVDRNH